MSSCYLDYFNKIVHQFITISMKPHAHNATILQVVTIDNASHEETASHKEMKRNRFWINNIPFLAK